MVVEIEPQYEVYACGDRFVGFLSVTFLTIDGNDVWHVHLTGSEGRTVLIARAEQVQSVTPLEDRRAER